MARKENVRQLANFIWSVADLHSTPTYEKDGKYPAICTADISPGELNILHANRVNDSDYLERIQRLKPQVDDKRVMMFRVHHHHSPHYIMWALNASCTYHQIRQDTVGATSPRVNIETIKEAWLPIPPHNEQVLISRKIFTSFEIIRVLTSAIENHIEKLQEYRRSLITAAVTGKLEISEGEADV
jgi:type I restriction enzyme, S subunit